MLESEEAKVIIGMGLSGIALIVGAVAWIWGVQWGALALGLTLVAFAIALT